jgi:hypothetical protein
MELLNIIEKFILTHKNDSIKNMNYINETNVRCLHNVKNKSDVRCLDNVKNIKIEKINKRKKCESYKINYGKCFSSASFINDNICLCWKHSYLLLNN